MIQKYSYLIVPLLWAITLLCLAPLFGMMFSSDSYSYYMIGKNILSGNGYLSPTIRENVIGANFHSRFFPPLFPILCGVSDVIFKKGIASGGIVNVAVLYGLFHVCYLIAKNLGGRLFYLLPVMCFYFIFTNTPFIYEIVTGCSIPLTTLLLLAILYLSITKETLSSRCYLVLGVLLGLLYLTRFDTALFCFIFPLAICLMRKESFRNALTMYLLFLLTISPWLISNILAFGSPLSANQSHLVISTSSINPILSFSQGVDVETVFFEPWLWMLQRVISFYWRAWSMYNYLTPLDWNPSFQELQEHIGSSVKTSLYVGFISVIGGAVIIASVITGFIYSKHNRPLYILIRATVLWVLINVGAISLTRLAETRYLSASDLLLLLAGLASIISIVKKQNSISEKKEPVITTSKQHALIAIVSAVIFGVVSWLAYPEIQRDNYGLSYQQLAQDFRPYIEKDALIGCRINRFQIAVYSDDLSYYTGWKTINMPLNTSSPDTTFIAWKHSFNVRYVIVDDTFAFKDSPRTKLLATAGEWKLVDIGGL